MRQRGNYGVLKAVSRLLTQKHGKTFSKAIQYGNMEEYYG